MAEEIEIVNVGGDGVASEATLKSLADAVKKLAQSTGKDPRTEEAKLMKTANEARKSGIEIIKDQNDAMEDLTTSTERANRQMNSMGKGIGNLVLNGLGAVLGSAVNLGKELAFGGDRMTDFAKHIPVVGEHLATLTQFVDDNINSFRQLAGLGVDFGESIFEVRRQAAVAGISLDAFQNVVANNSEVLAQFGGNAERGARAFAQVSGSVQAQMGPQLSRLGITMEEAGEMTASYLNIQTRVGRTQTMSQAQLSAGAGEYLLQLDRLSKITGKSREALAAELEQNAVSPAMAILNSTLADGGLQIQGTLQTLRDKVGPEAADALETLIARNGVPIMGTLSQGLAQLNPEIMTLAQGLRDGSMDMEDAVRIMGDTQAMAARRAKNEGDILTVLAEQGNVQALAVSSMLGFNTAVEDLTGATDIQRKAMGDQSRGLLDFERQVANARNEFNRSFVENGIFSGLQEALSGGLSSGLTIALGSAAVVTAIAGTFAAASLKNRIGDFLGGGRESNRGGRRGGRAGGTGMLGGLIGGIGRGGAMAITALTTSLSAAGAAAAPMALGALVISGAIIGIGAAIAGATWMIGKSLPTFAEGLEAIGELDGGALIDSAKGLGAISAGIIAFGGATFVSAIGNLAGSTLDTLNNFLGGESLFAKLERFNKLDIDAESMKSNAEAMTVFGTALGSLNIGEAAFGTTLANLFDGLTSFFGGDTELPFTKIKAFSEADLGDAAKIKSNAESVVAFGDAMGSLSPLGDSFATFAGQVFDGLSQAFFGEVTYPWDKVKLFAAADLDSAGIKKNSEAVVAFGNALASIPVVDKTRVGGLFNSIIDAFIGAEVYPWDKVKTFGETDLDPNGFITKNASSIAGFAAAVNSSNATAEIKTDRVGGMFSAIISAFAGTAVYPWEKVKTFGETDLDPNGFIVKNASAIAGFAQAVNASNTIGEIDTERAGGLFGLVAYAFAGGTQFPWDAVQEFGKTELDPNGNIEANAAAMANFSNGLAGFKDVDIGSVVIPNIGLLAQGIRDLDGAFDSEKIDDYEDALYNLKDTIDLLNEKIRENNALAAQTIGNQAAAGGGNGGGGGSSRELVQLLSQLNTTMENMKEELDDQGDTHDRVMRAVRALRPGI